ncbi:MAG: DNA/RNA non-specific endonuclease, partial [Ruminococcus sp.]|nr:DNA/RNA non-specific endonuclease [Ruminococcus sp.]
LGRCGEAYANICQELMPTEERGNISSVKPSGWVNAEYDFIDGKYLYNRCHLIGFQLAGENANECNLITGTRYFNVEGMLPFENMIADYVKETENHVLYRVTPIYEGSNLVASGVQMEAKSVEDDGEGILFNVYCYNVQPGVEIDYATGESWEADNTASSAGDEQGDYILNTNSKKFHTPDCSGANLMKASNRQEYSGSRDLLIKQGYEPCKTCNP